MKVILLIIASIVAVQAATDEQQERLEKYSKECLSISKVDANVLAEAKKGSVATDDPKLQDHAFCFSKKASIQDDKGEYNVDLARSRLAAQMKDKAEVEKVLKLCLVKKDTPGSSAISTWKCFNENLPKDVVAF